MLSQNYLLGAGTQSNPLFAHLEHISLPPDLSHYNASSLSAKRVLNLQNKGEKRATLTFAALQLMQVFTVRFLAASLRLFGLCPSISMLRNRELSTV